MTVDEAEAHFADLVREVSEGDGPVMVEQDGEARIVILSLEEYARMHPSSPTHESWQDLVRNSRELIAQERAGRELPPPEETSDRRLANTVRAKFPRIRLLD